MRLRWAGRGLGPDETGEAELGRSEPGTSSMKRGRDTHGSCPCGRTDEEGREEEKERTRSANVTRCEGLAAVAMPQKGKTQ